VHGSASKTPRRFVDFDFVDQYLKRYVEGMEAGAF
jgi:hypothetical protein